MINIKIDKSDKCNGDYSLFVSFNYDPNIVSILREQTIRYYHPDTKEWELPIKSFNNLKNALQDYSLNIIDSSKILSNFDFNRRDSKLYT